MGTGWCGWGFCSAWPSGLLSGDAPTGGFSAPHTSSRSLFFTLAQTLQKPQRLDDQLPRGQGGALYSLEYSRQELILVLGDAGSPQLQPLTWSKICCRGSGLVLPAQVAAGQDLSEPGTGPNSPRTALFCFEVVKQSHCLGCSR